METVPLLNIVQPGETQRRKSKEKDENTNELKLSTNSFLVKFKEECLSATSRRKNLPKMFVNKNPNPPMMRTKTLNEKYNVKLQKVL